MSYAHGGKREGIAAQGNAVGPAEGKQIEQPQQTQGALANGDGLARQLRQAQEALANGDVLAKRSCGKCKRRSPMEMCWRRTAAASARGARQWRCAGEDQRRQAQGAFANVDVLARSSCGQRKRRSPMEMCWQRAGAAGVRGARQWRCAGEEQLRQAQGALPNGDVLEKSSGGKRKGRSPMEMGWQDSCGKCVFWD